ncbi:MAG: kinase [Glaciecola sp.]|jgi:D-glycerate 3-kinase
MHTKQSFLTEHGLSSNYWTHALKWFAKPLDSFLSHQSNAKPLLLGLNGAQGSGKSTLAAWLAFQLQAVHKKSAVVLSIDDFYYSQQHRATLAQTVHPLLTTRGVPGTHDIELANTTITKLMQGEPVALPRFSKADDDPIPTQDWPLVTTAPDVIILEGWCVGITPESKPALVQPINALETDYDPDGVWRHYVNQALHGYQSLFARCDQLWALLAPSFTCVYHWRLEQEHKLAQRASGSGVMSDEQVRDFIAHYQRLTTHALATLPHQADVWFAMDEHRMIQSMTQNGKID